VNTAGESNRSLSLLSKLSETLQLRPSAGECECARGVSLNVGVRSVRCGEACCDFVCLCQTFRTFAGEFLLFVSWCKNNGE